jgi:hypothetical protein
MVVSDGWQFQVFGRPVYMRTLYTPMLVLTVLAVVRIAWPYKASLPSFEAKDVWRVVTLASVAVLVTAVLMSPLLYAIVLRVVEGQWDPQQIFWRSSPGGIDLLALVLPNPNHPFTPEALRAWLPSNSDAYQESVASLPFVAMATLAIAWWAGWKVPRLWAGLALAFGALALGPFVHVAGANTYVPGPWAVLRYVPVVGLARMPARLKVVLMLAVAVLFACALSWLVKRWPERRRLLLPVVGAFLMIELLPAPRPLFSAAIPHIYQPIAQTASDLRILQLPVGVRDGTFSVGSFTALWQYFQTAHGKPLIGGQLSRVSKRRVAEIRSDVVVDALITLSEDRALDPVHESHAIKEAPAFLEQRRIAFVVIDHVRAPEALQRFAIRALGLEHVDSDGPFELYRPSPIAQTVRSEPGSGER